MTAELNQAPGSARAALTDERRGAVSLASVSRSYGAVAAVREVSLDVRPGEFLTLLGPSGCGKTTLLRLVAGFEEPDGGRILISGRDLTDVPAHRRPVNTVFQHYALFPHRTVAGNVAFGLETAGRSRDDITSRVARALEMVRLTGLGERRISQLSGGQRQRVALARAVVMEPEVLLLDEPLAALDLKLRKEMQVEVKNLQERLGTTFVFVTHDQDEALVMSDRIAVMNDGRIEQVDAPEEIYQRPRTRFVAEFLAVRNVLCARLAGAASPGSVRLRTEGGLELLAADDGGFGGDGPHWIGFRPERLRLGPAGDGPSAILDDEIYRGDHTEWRVRVGGEVLAVTEDASAAAGRRRGDAVSVQIPPDAVLRLAP
jgi:ABC-type Fe3+/spermidine/putrescine transport system ATPase subunit